MAEIAKIKEELKKDGMKLASISEGEHPKRTVEMYQELGFDAYLEAVSPEECRDCTKYNLLENETIYRIYTKAKDSYE